MMALVAPRPSRLWTPTSRLCHTGAELPAHELGVTATHGSSLRYGVVPRQVTGKTRVKAACVTR